MVVEASKFLFLDTSENYKQVEILLKLVDELLLENIINVYFISTIIINISSIRKFILLSLTALNFTANCSFVDFTSGQKLY